MSIDMTHEIAIRQAGLSDAEAIAAILREASQWLTASSEPMWLEGELEIENIAPGVEAGLFFLADCAGDAAGTLKFELEDPDFWPEMPDGDAAYLHRLAVRRRYAGVGLSTALLGWAAARTRTLGRPYLRLDCEASRPRLRAFYERFGFRHHSDRQVRSYFVSRYEFPVFAER
jgi:GNAT superfamily N-acetyltransferase